MWEGIFSGKIKNFIEQELTFLVLDSIPGTKPREEEALYISKDGGGGGGGGGAQ